MSNSVIPITMIAAVAKNGVIGSDGIMPWRLMSDLKRFKQITICNPVIMGRKTHESIGRLLPKRLNVIVTRSNKAFKGALTCNSLNEAIAKSYSWAVSNGAKKICVIGGGQIYVQAINIAQRLYITHVLENLEGDTFFPEINKNVWSSTYEKKLCSNEQNSHATHYIIYEKK